MGLSNHTAIILPGGGVQTFGSNSSGQLGNGTNIDSTIPVNVIGIVNASFVSCGGSHTVVLLEDGTVKTFGSNPQEVAEASSSLPHSARTLCMQS